jgi:3-oxoadipate enol-lactonase
MEGPPPVPPAWLPEGRTALLPGRGEIFYRDSGPETGRAGTLLLLHGWTVTADLNWAFAYRPLVDGGYRVIAPDHRGHGRGLRAPAKFRLVDCAADAAELVVQLGAAPVTVVGYSMGGAIAQLVARQSPHLVAGVVLSATSLHWSGARDRTAWRAMRAFQWLLRMFPHRFFRGLLRSAGERDAARASWALGEFARGSADDIAEAGRELGRFDSRPWIRTLETPISVIIPREDQLIAPQRQREMAALIPGATVREVPGDHAAISLAGAQIVGAILDAVAEVRAHAVIESRPSPAPSPVG